MKQRMILVLLILAIAGLVYWRFHPRASEHGQAGEIIRGYEENISLTPVLVPLEMCENRATMPDVADRAAQIQPVLMKVFQASCADSNSAAISGSNWMNAAFIDDTRDTSVGADAWQKAVTLEMKKTGVTIDESAGRIRYWPPALLHFNRARIFDGDFVAKVVGHIGRNAETVRSSLKTGDVDTSAVTRVLSLYEASLYFHGLPASQAWRLDAEQGLERYFKKHQKPDGTIDGDVAISVATIETVMPSLALAYRAGIPVKGVLAGDVQRLLDVLMYALDMDGFLPFSTVDENVGNKREWLFWGSRIFNRPDYGWVAYGGLDALEIAPPRKTSMAFPDAGLYVMRNNWNIRRMAQRGILPDKSEIVQTNGMIWSYYEFNGMSDSVWIDARQGVAEIYAFGERQIRITFPFERLDVREWRTGATGSVFRCASEKGNLTVVHLPEKAAWALNFSGLKKDSGVTISPLRVDIQKTVASEGIVTKPEDYIMSRDNCTELRNKPFGSVCIRTEGGMISTTSNLWTVHSTREDGSVTLVIVGASGTWPSDLNENPLIAPERAAENRQIQISADGCVVDEKVGDGNADENNGKTRGRGFHLKFDGSGIMLDGKTF